MGLRPAGWEAIVKRIHAAVLSMLVLAALIGAAGAVMLSRVERVKDGVIRDYSAAFTDSIDVERLRGESERLARLVRSYLIQPSDLTLEQLHEARAEFDGTLQDLEADPSPHLDLRGLQRVDQIEDDARAAADAAIASRAGGSDPSRALAFYENKVGRARERLDAALGELVRVQEHVLDDARASADAVTDR